MGATNFETSAIGKTAQEAFNAAVREARYLHGNQGYTGTIAEKNSFVEIGVPSGLTYEEFVGAILDDQEKWATNSRYMNCRGSIKYARRMWDDKYGPALCIARNEGGTTVYRFLGMASS